MTLADDIAQRSADAILARGLQKDKPLLIARPEKLHALMTTVRAAGFDHLSFVAAVDWPYAKLKDNAWLPAEVRALVGLQPEPDAPPADKKAPAKETGAATPRAPQGASKAAPEGGSGETPEGLIEIVYNLYAIEKREHLAIQAWIPRELDLCRIASVADIWPGANWHEREAYDLYGVTFEGHPDLKRIFMPEGWTGHPGRRDYDLGREQFIYRDGGEDLVTFDPGKGW